MVSRKTRKWTVIIEEWDSKGFWRNKKRITMQEAHKIIVDEVLKEGKA